MSFYVTLLSDDLENGLTTNVQNAFTTFLTPTLQLQGGWEVALTELTCSNGHKVNLGSMIINDKDTYTLEYQDGMTINEVAKSISETIKASEPHDVYNILGTNASENDVKVKAMINSLNKKKNTQFIRIDKNVIIAYGNLEHRQYYLAKLMQDIKNAQWPSYIASIDVNPTYTKIQLADAEFNEASLTPAELNIISEHTKIKTEHHIKKREMSAEIKRLVQNYRRTENINSIIKNCKTRVTQYKELTEVRLTYLVGEWYDIHESDYDNELYSVVEAKADISMLNIRKLKFDKIEFRGIIACIMNQDPAKRSYVVDKPFDTIHFVPELNLVNQFVIYTDMIEEQYYGGRQLQVLHTLNLSRNAPLTIDSPHYVRVNKSSITSINIRICDRTGEPIKFSDQFSNVLVKLHFRKK